MPTIASHARWTIAAGGRSSTGIASSPAIGVGAEAGQDRAEVRDLDAADDLPVDEDPADRLGLVRPPIAISSIAANFAGWSSSTPRAAMSPTTTWTGAAIGGEDERDQEAEPDVAVGVAAKQADGVDRRRAGSP